MSRIGRTAAPAALALCTLATAASAAAPPATTPSADGIPIAYHVQGQGTPALVLVHCWTCDSSFWDEQVKHEAATHQVVTLDLAGHGRSGTGRADWTIPAFGDDVVAVVKKLGLRQVILVGHSMGGPVVVEAARKMPERVLGIVLVDTLLDVGQAMPAEQIDAAMAEMKADFKGASARFMRDYMFVPTTPRWLVDDVLARTAAADPAMAIPALRNTWAYDGQAGFAAVKAPIVAVNSSRFPTNLEANRKAAPQFDAILVEGVGHYLMREKPELFDTAFDHALGRVVAAAKKTGPR